MLLYAGNSTKNQFRYYFLCILIQTNKSKLSLLYIGVIVINIQCARNQNFLLLILKKGNILTLIKKSVYFK